MAQALRVLLGALPVGRLTLDSGDGCDFRLMETFLRMARKIGVADRLMLFWLHQARTAVLDAWRDHGQAFGFTAPARETINQHMARVPLLLAQA